MTVINGSIIAERGPGPVRVTASPLALAPPAAFALFFLFALALRFSLLGNPDFHVDEEFYFAVADRMWRGDLPYVDVWDRKPIGLFLIYAALRPLSGDAMLAVQLAGHLFTATAALLIWDLSRNHIGRAKALIPALIYVVWMGPFGGSNGQAPVFFNPVVTLAFWLLVRGYGDKAREETLWYGVGSMALIGVAIQIKYTPVFPGFFFGLCFMWREWSHHRDVRRLCLRASLWAAVALLPTLAALGFYAARGHAEAFVFANFTSIFLRKPLEPEFLYGLKQFMALRAAPLVLTAAAGALVWCQSRRHRTECALVVGWLVAEVAALVFVGNYYDHYALPLVAPLALLTTMVFAEARPLQLAIFGFLVIVAHVPDPRVGLDDTVRSREAIFGLTETARPYLRHGCLFVFDGPSILYSTTGACTLTKFIYPDHLSNAVEADALGTDSVAELAHVIAQRPAVIVTSTRGLIPVWNGRNRQMIDGAIEKDYRLVDYALEGFRSRYYLMWARTDLIAPGTPILTPPSQAELEERHRNATR